MLTLILAVAIGLFDEPQAAAQEQKQRYIPNRQFQLKDLQVEELKFTQTTDTGEKVEHKIKSWVMDTEAKRQEGLMFVLDSDMKADQGMIFVFKAPEPLRFWMMNTYIPLDIAYLDKDGVVVKTYTMIAHDTTTDYSSIKPAMYAWELKQGTLRKLGLKAGMKVTIPEKVKAKE